MKSSFVMYGSWGPMVEAMSDEQAGQLIKACYALHNGKDYEITDSTVKIVFETVKATMDADREKYAEVSKKRRDAALASKSQQMHANANKSIQEDANASKCSFCSDLLYESASVSDSDNDKDIKEKIQKEKSASRRRVFVKPSLEEVREYCRQREGRFRSVPLHQLPMLSSWKYPVPYGNALRTV